MVLATSVATCRIADIVGKPKGALLAVKPELPESLKAGSAFGSTAPAFGPIEVINEGDGELRWKARTRNASPWVTLEPDTGTAGSPPGLQAVFNPSGLDSGVYEDTVLVEDRAGTGSQLVHLWYKVRSCDQTIIGVPDSSSTSLTTADCGAPHRRGRFAKIYLINSATADDSLTIDVTAAYDAYVAFDTSLAENALPFAQSNTCLGAGRDPCLYYQKLPRNGTYYVEVTSADSADTGAFKVRVLHPRAPLDPTSLQQFLADSATAILLGGGDSLSTVVVGGVVSDPDLGDTLHLEAEIRPVAAAFTGSPTAIGGEVLNGSPAFVAQTALLDNTAYHWRIHAVDQTGRPSENWVEFGGNPTSAPDFLVDVPQPPSTPSAMGQFEGDSSTSIGTGASARSDTVVFRAQVSDPDPADLLRLYVEVKPTTTAFSNTATDSSSKVGVGGAAFVRIGPLANNVNYHWQTWTVDQTGRSSAKASYGGNAENSTDFRIQVPNPPNLPTSLNQFQSDATTVIPPGGDANVPTVVFKGTVSDGDVGQTVRLDVEVQPSTTPFTNAPTISSTFVANGSVATVNVTSPFIAAGGNYHWQARAVDNTSLPSPWVSFPPDTGRDFHVATTVAELVFTQQPVADTAGRPVRPAVVVAARDANHNVVTSFTGPITMSIANNPGGGTLSGMTVVNATAGVATFSNLIIDKVGTGYTLQATAGAITSVPPSNAFNVIAGPATQLSFSVQPTNTQATQIITPAVVVQALDAQGNVATSYASNIIMTIGNNPAGGTLGGTTTQLAVAGVATFNNLTIDKVGPGYTLRAASGTLTAATSLSFNITNIGNTHLTFTTQPTTTQAGVAINSPGNVVVTAQDQSGQTVTTFTGLVTMTIGTNPSSGTLSGTLAVNAVAGVATFNNLKIDKAGAGYTLSASESSAGSVVSQAFTITPGPTSQLVFNAQPTDETAGIPISPAVVVGGRDQFGNVTTLTGTVSMGFAVNPVGGAFTASSTTSVTAAGGVATFSNLRINRAGSGYALQATAGSLTSVPASNTFTITPAPAVSLVFTQQPTNTGAGAAITPAVVVSARDSLANTATSFTSVVTMAVAAGPGTFASTSTNTATAVGGVATFGNLRIYQAGSGYQLRASSGTLISLVSNSFTITAAPSVKLAFTTQPTNTAVLAKINDPTGVVVTVQDSVGNTTPFGGTVRINLGTDGAPGGGSTLSGGGAITAPTGVATFPNLTINKVGTGFTLLAATTTSGVGGDESTPFNIVTGPPTKLAFTTTPSSSAQSGVAFAQQPVIQIQDANGFPVSQGGTVITATFASGTGSLTNPTATTNASGTATFAGLAITGLAGNYTLSFGATGLTSVTSGTIVLSAGAATQLVIGTQPSASAQNGVAFAQQPTVQLRDASGNSVSQANVTVTATVATGPGGATLTNPTALTNASGLATFSGLAITGTVGSYTLRFGSGSLTPDTSTAIALSAGSATQLVIATQPSTSAQNGVAFAQQPAVQLRDVGGNPVSQANVTVTASVATGPGGATLTNPTALTNASGLATFSGLAITGTVGSYTLRFGSGSLTPDTSTAIALSAGLATKLGITTQPSTSAQSGVAFAQQPVIQIQDASGNAVSQNGTVITATIVSGPSGTLSNNTATTNANGTATFAGLAINGLVGTYTLDFNGGGLTKATSNSINLATGPATKLAITIQPTTAVAGVAISPAIQVIVQDAGGNTVTSPRTDITMAIGTNPGNGTLSGMLTVRTGVGTGTSSFSDLSINKAASGYTLVASATGLASATSSTFAITPAAAAVLIFTQEPSDGTANTALSPAVVVTVRDQFGNTANFIGTVTLTVVGGGSGITGNSVSAESGVATFSNLILDTPGTYTLNADGGGLPTVQSTSFIIS